MDFTNILHNDSMHKTKELILAFVVNKVCFRSLLLVRLLPCALDHRGIIWLQSAASCKWYLLYKSTAQLKKIRHKRILYIYFTKCTRMDWTSCLERTANNYCHRYDSLYASLLQLFGIAASYLKNYTLHRCILFTI